MPCSVIVEIVITHIIEYGSIQNICNILFQFTYER